MGIDSVIGAVVTDGDEVADVAIAERAGREVGDDVIEVSDDKKTFPPLGDCEGDTAVDHARAAEAKADEVFAQIGAMEIDKLMAEDG